MLTCLFCPRRRELGQMGSAMVRLQAEHEEERAQLQVAEGAASQLQQSCEEMESLRTRQADLAERITLMQTLLEVTPSARSQMNVLQPGQVVPQGGGMSPDKEPHVMTLSPLHVPSWPLLLWCNAPPEGHRYDIYSFFCVLEAVIVSMWRSCSRVTVGAVASLEHCP